MSARQVPAITKAKREIETCINRFIGPTFMFQEVVYDSSGRYRQKSERCCYCSFAYMHLDNQTDLYEMGQTIYILIPTVAVSAVTCRLKGEMIPCQRLNTRGKAAHSLWVPPPGLKCVKVF